MGTRLCPDMDNEEFSVEFDRPGAVFYPGEEISGKVVLSVDSTKEVSGLQLLLRGSGQVERSYSKFGIKKRCRNDEVYCNIETWLEVQGAIPSGEITYPFAIVLPSVLPSSYQGPYGHVRYTAKATIFCLSNPENTAEKSFKVEAKCDLNTNVEARLAPECFELKLLDWCNFGPLLVNMRLSKGGYVPGETIMLSGIAKNRSNREIQRVIVSLQQVIMYNQKFGSKESVEERKTLIEEDIGWIEPRSEQIWTDVALLVPPVPPTDLGMSGGIIGVRYQLKIKAKPAYRWTRLIARLPVIIGTIPLREARNITPLNPATASVHSATVPSITTGHSTTSSRKQKKRPETTPSDSESEEGLRETPVETFRRSVASLLHHLQQLQQQAHPSYSDCLREARDELMLASSEISRRDLVSMVQERRQRPRSPLFVAPLDD